MVDTNFDFFASEFGRGQLKSFPNTQREVTDIFRESEARHGVNQEHVKGYMRAPFMGVSYVPQMRGRASRKGWWCCMECTRKVCFGRGENWIHHPTVVCQGSMEEVQVPSFIDYKKLFYKEEQPDIYPFHVAESTTVLVLQMIRNLRAHLVLNCEILIVIKIDIFFELLFLTAIIWGSHFCLWRPQNAPVVR